MAVAALLRSMAATGGLRSGAALPSLATRIARASPQPHHPRILTRRLHCGSTPPPTTDKDKIIDNLRRERRLARAVTGIGGVVLLGLGIYGHFWLLPGLKKMRDRAVAFDRLERGLRDERLLAEIIQTAVHIKQQRNGRTENGKRVGKLEDVMAACFHILNEMRADLKEFRAATAHTYVELEVSSFGAEGRV